MNTQRHIISVLALAVALLLPQQALAAVSLDLGTLYYGDSPIGTGPWVKATFSDYGPGQVLLTLSDVNLQGAESISRLGFNFNPGKTVTDLQFVSVAGVQPGSMNPDLNGVTVGPVIGFDFDVNFSPFNTPTDHFGVGSTSSVLISGIPDLNENDFNFSISAMNLTMYAAAHINFGLPGFTSGPEGSWVAATSSTPTSVPEPATMLLLGLGLAGLACARRPAA